MTRIQHISLNGAKAIPMMPQQKLPQEMDFFKYWSATHPLQQSSPPPALHMIPMLIECACSLGVRVVMTHFDTLASVAFDLLGSEVKAVCSGP